MDGVQVLLRKEFRVWVQHTHFLSSPSTLAFQGSVPWSRQSGRFRDTGSLQVRHGLEKPDEAWPTEKGLCEQKTALGAQVPFQWKTRKTVCLFQWAWPQTHPEWWLYLCVKIKRRNTGRIALFSLIPKLIYIFDYKDNITTTQNIWETEEGKKCL